MEDQQRQGKDDVCGQLDCVGGGEGRQGSRRTVSGADQLRPGGPPQAAQQRGVVPGDRNPRGQVGPAEALPGHLGWAEEAAVGVPEGAEIVRPLGDRRAPGKSPPHLGPVGLEHPVPGEDPGDLLSEAAVVARSGQGDGDGVGGEGAQSGKAVGEDCQAEGEQSQRRCPRRRRHSSLAN